MSHTLCEDSLSFILNCFSYSNISVYKSGSLKDQPLKDSLVPNVAWLQNPFLAPFIFKSIVSPSVPDRTALFLQVQAVTHSLINDTFTHPVFNCTVYDDSWSRAELLVRYMGQ